jgi:uncharacterized protein involved in exopolysaccharide biosynthesis
MEPEKYQNNASPNREAEEVDLLDLLLVLVKKKKLILGSMAVAFVLACGITLLMPNIYIATARILPPQQEKGGLGAMVGGVSDLAALAGLSVGGGSSGELYVGMLKSRAVEDPILERFDLMKVYDQKYRSTVYGVLEQHVDVSLGKKDGILTISVEDKDPSRAAAMANAFVGELKKLNVEVNISSAGRQRQFLEKRLEVVKHDLTAAEDRLKVFQEKNKAIRIDDQAKAIIEAISKLKGELASKEVELGVALSYQTEQNPQVKTLREGIAQIKDQLRRLEQSSAGKRVSGDIFIATSDVPELGVQYGRLLREFQVQETIFELLTKQYEVAKIEEAKNTSTIQVLDHAFVPDRKSKPKRSLIVLVATFAAGFVVILGACILEAGKKMNDQSLRRWEEIRSLLKPHRKILKKADSTSK